MSIPKIIKGYFIFMLVLSSVATMSYNHNFEDMLTSTFHSSVESMRSPFTVIAANSFEDEKKDGVLKLTTKKNTDFTFSVSNPSDKRFAEPSSANNNMMTITFKAKKDSTVKNIRLKLVGTDSSNVGRVTLMDGNKIAAIGKRDGNYFYFVGIDLKVNSEKSKSLVLKVNLSSSLKASDRFRMDIESAEDIEVKVGRTNYEVMREYPVKGSYLTVSKNRIWGPYYSKES